VGHGFVKDDFNWILTSRVARTDDLQRLVGAATGFFRPLVSATFAIDHTLFGLHPRGYGLTNLGLLLACVGLLTLVLRAFELEGRIAVAAALLWALNFHGINMAVLWISGRTALLVTLFALAAALCWTRGSRGLAAIPAMAAMWSKEEGFVLPVIFTAWSLIDHRATVRRGPTVARETWPLWVAAAASLLARASTEAFTPGSAPAAYQYQYDLSTFAANALAYLDRTSTTAVLALLVLWLVCGRQPRPGVGVTAGPDEAIRFRQHLYKGAIWAVLALAPTILLPVRSSLYAVLPSVGVLLMVACVADRVAARASPSSLSRALVILLVIFLALAPVYRARNRRHVMEAVLSSAILGQMPAIVASHPDGGLVVIEDVRDARPTAEQAFGPLIDRAAQLVSGGTLRLWINPPPGELAGVEPPPDVATPIAILEVSGGKVRRVK
jgi:hypothetical protein